MSVSAMTEDELRAAVTGPAAAVGIDFEDGLVALILGDVGDKPGNMPLLQLANSLEAIATAFAC